MTREPATAAHEPRFGPDPLIHCACGTSHRASTLLAEAAAREPEAVALLRRIATSYIGDDEADNPILFDRYRSIVREARRFTDALANQPATECPHGNGLSCRECQSEAEADDATWD